MRHFLSFILLLLVLAGCTTGVTQVDRVAPSTTLADTSPGQLDLRVHLSYGTTLTSPSQALLTLAVSQGIKLVQFTRNEQMICNGVTLGRFTGAFEAAFPVSDLEGHSLVCTYTSGSASATLAATLPPAPVILVPHDGAAVARSAQTLVRYTARSSPFHLIAMGPTSKVFSVPATQGPTMTLLDTRSLTSGAGMLTLAEEVTPFPCQGPAFHSLSGDVSASATVAVTWT
ncbi:MAG: hypothetical protein H0X24_06395 [Ktedonobacterales bacterium]|nr:hypothetical protein [Ktedonobacterales bacterium]